MDNTAPDPGETAMIMPATTKVIQVESSMGVGGYNKEKRSPEAAGPVSDRRWRFGPR